jgi:2-succinyl-6-hydroxy-2,4-cyclohexadiene-1-carboxylate synthase
MTRVEVNGSGVNVVVQGDGPALLLLHGFTGSHATWAPFADEWSGFTTIAVDIVGHGQSDSPRDPDRYRMERCVEDLVAVLDRFGVERTAVVGYSMGGRAALHLALFAPARLHALVLESASTGIDDPCGRAARVRSDFALAEAIERDGIESFVEHWEALPLFASQRRLPTAVRESLRRQRLQNSALGLANSLRAMGAGAQAPLSRRLREVRVPVLLLAGSLDDKYRRLAQRMEAELPHARVEIVPDAGHAVHLEQPDVFAQLVRSFLEECALPQREREE